MSTFEKIKTSLELLSQCTVLARQFVDLVDRGNSLYSLVNLGENGFAFSYGPTTHGTARHAELPYALLDEPEQLKVLAEQEKEKIDRWRQESTCKHCGSFKISNVWNSGVYS
jgi:hypothetical protein